MSLWRSFARRLASTSLLGVAVAASPVSADPPSVTSTATAAVAPAAITTSAPVPPSGPAAPDPAGEALGDFRMTFYWVADEKEYPGERPVERIHGRDGDVLGTFGERFARALRMEGTGRTAGGTLLNWAGRHCGPPRRVVERVRDRRGRLRRQVRMEPTSCFVALDPTRYPFGMGVQGYRLIPYRTVAVDLSRIPPATPLFVPEMVGVRLPDGTRHDGCVVAVDTGGGIRGARLDFFVPTQAEFREAFRQLPRRSQITVVREPARCAYARAYAWRPPAAERPVIDPAHGEPVDAVASPPGPSVESSPAPSPVASAAPEPSPAAAPTPAP